MMCESRPLCAVAPASWLPRLSSPPLGRVQAWKGSGRCRPTSLSPRWDSLRQFAPGGRRTLAGPGTRSAGSCVPGCRLGRCSHTSSSARLMALNCPFPQGSWRGNGGRGTLRSQVSPECQVGIFWPLWGEEPIPRSAPLPRRLPHPL